MSLLISFGRFIYQFIYLTGQMISEFYLQIRRGLGNWQGVHLVVKQIYLLGFKSLSIIALSGVFVGAIITYQGYLTLNQFGSADGLSQLVALSLYRELGPVLSALLFAGRSGSSVTAELVLMRAGDQIDAIRVMGGSISGLLLLPRFIATWIVMMMLSVVFIALAVFAGALIAQSAFDMNMAAFFTRLTVEVPFVPNVIMCVAKALVFAVWVSMVMVHYGMTSPKTNQGIAQAVTKTVVQSSIGIFVLDYFITVFFPIGG